MTALSIKLSESNLTEWNQVLQELDCDLTRLVMGRLVNQSLLDQTKISVSFYFGEFGSVLGLQGENTHYQLFIDSVEEAKSVDPGDRLFSHLTKNVIVYWEWSSGLSDQENLETVEQSIQLFLEISGCLPVQGGE